MTNMWLKRFFVLIQVDDATRARQFRKAVVTTSIRFLIRPRFDRRSAPIPFVCNSAALRPFDDLRHDRAAALWPELINRSAWLRLAGYVTVTFTILISSRTPVESKSNRSCDHRITEQSFVNNVILRKWNLSLNVEFTIWWDEIHVQHC